MSTKTNGIGVEAPPTPPVSTPRKLKILMLHGFTQNGPLFHAKTRALEKFLAKAFPANNPTTTPLKSYPGGIQLIYPTGPIRLQPADVPGASGGEEEELDAWGWWTKTPSGEYHGLEDGLSRIAETMRKEGPIDGVIGFSQGAAATVLVASLLEPGRESTFSALQTKGGIPFPASFSHLGQSQPPLKFAICYSGFYAPFEGYRGFYDPRITTPTLHVIGSCDTVVEEGRSLALLKACEKGKEVYHPGGHFVPVGKEMAGVVMSFIKECCVDPVMEVGDVRDMDVPF